MSTMDGLRAQLADVQETLRDVVGRLDALEQRAPDAQTKPLATVAPTETKPKVSAPPVSPVPPTSAGSSVTRKP